MVGSTSASAPPTLDPRRGCAFASDLFLHRWSTMMFSVTRTVSIGTLRHLWQALLLVPIGLDEGLALVG